MTSADQVRSLFRTLLRQGRAFPNYNVREYILRTSGDMFRSAAGLKDDVAIEQAFMHGQKELDIVKRQSLVYQLYSRNIKTVLEMKPQASN